MLRDVFYYGKKPNVHPRERYAENLEHARSMATTEHFWIINEFCDYRKFDWDFDFEFLPDEDVWAEAHNNVWPSQHQKDSGTWLCSKEHSDLIIYRSDVDPVYRKNIKSDNWVELDLIDETKFDFSWHPDPSSPPYIYKWGCKFFPAQLKHVLEYHVAGATQEKYMDTIVELSPESDRWIEYQAIDKNYFDLSWRPNPMDPPFIYVWGNKYVDGKLKPTLEYHAPGATDKKYMPELLKVLPEWDKWNIIHSIDMSTFDFTWRPDPREPNLIYVFGNKQHVGNIMPTIEYVMEGAVDRKYINDDEFRPLLLPDKTKFQHLENSDGIDYSWRPDPTSPPYIYAWGNQWNKAEDKVSIQYVVEGATEYKYMEERAKRKPCMDNWVVPLDIDDTGFDYSWEPNPHDPPYIYEFSTQWQKTGGPKYVVEGATEIKYMDIMRVRKLPSMDNWTVPNNVDVSNFDFSWHPDATSPPYIYNFPTQWALSGGPSYTVDGAKEIKYVEDQKAIALPDRTNWDFDENILDVNSFDFSWHPYVEDQPYIYQFGTQHQKTGGPRYMTPGVHKNSPVKYIDTRIIKAKRLFNIDNWNVVGDLKVFAFDYSWHPDDTEEPYIYIFGNTQYPAEVMPTMEYRVPGATQIKYINSVAAKLAPDMENWVTPDDIDTTDFDYSWKPNPHDPPYVYEFGTQWQKTGGPCYVVEGATERKYVDGSKAKKLPSKENWTIPNNLDISGFDFSWHPDATSPPYIYVFATQWALSGGPVYTVPGASEVKYSEDQFAKALPDKTNWVYDETEIDVDSFDFSWHPYVEDQPYIYQFGTQHQKTGGPKYMTPGVDSQSPVKYIDTRIIKAKRLPNKNKFTIDGNFEIKDFDYSWHPDDTSPPYIYVFGNNLYPAEECATISYRVKGGKEVKFITDIVATLGPNMNNWEIPEGINVDRFDFSWIPHPSAPPYIYQFGTLQDPTDGPRYITPETNGEIVKLPRIEIEEVKGNIDNTVVKQYYIETTLEELVAKHESELFWALNPDIDYTNFDFDWRPSIEQAEYVHAFGSAASEKTQTYFINGPQWAKGNRDFNWVQNVELTEKALAEMFVKPDMFYVDKGNSESQSRFDMLKAKFGNKIQKTRYLNSWVDTINRCVNRSTTTVIWVLNSELDYSSFNFDYYPNPWQMKMVQVFGTQWSHWGTTFMVNRETFPEDTKYIKIIEHLNNLNFVKDIRARATKCVYDIVLIDHGNSEAVSVQDLLKKKVGDKTVTTVKYDESYLNTLREVIRKQPEKKDHYLWICSSVCDYRDFDFSYICDPFAKDQLHVFPSGKQKFGDTFFIDVNKTRDLIDNLDVLESYQKVNYNATMRVPRLPEPTIVTSDDTLVEAATKIDSWPYVTLITNDNKDIDSIEVEPMNLWAPDTKNILVTSTGSSRIIVPREVKDHIKKELYDYPYIKKSTKLAKSNPLDIVFLSNGETGADENYEHLLKVTKGLKNRVVRVDGVNGRAAAYHAAAEASNTPWMFTVFAKLKVSAKFDWNWQPDRMQVPKHYIFQAKNPVNGLVYGHQAMIAYNKRLTLANTGRGLDFTLDDEHEVVELLSGTAMYNTDEFSTWRTAFREVLKLRQENSDIARERLDAWMNKAEGDFAQYSIKGAVDADEYYDEVKGDFNELKKSYEWVWLRERFEQL